MVNPGNRGDGGPVGTYSCARVLVCECSPWELPACAVGPPLQGRVCAPFVRVDPAGVQVAEEESLVIWLALVLVSFSHDQVLDVGQWVVLVQVGGVLERVVLLEELDDMCMQ